MNALELIERDVARERASVWPVRVGLPLFLLTLPIVLGLGLREDLNGVFAPLTLLCNVVLAALLSTAPLVYHFGRRSLGFRRAGWLLVVGLVVVLGLSLKTLVLAEVTTVYRTGTEFWHEALKCVAKASATSSLAWGVTTLVVFGYSALPSRPWRLALCFAAALEGVAMTSFHCDSSAGSHLVVSHWLPSFVAAVVGFVVQNLVFRALLARRLAGLDVSGVERGLW